MIAFSPVHLKQFDGTEAGRHGCQGGKLLKNNTYVSCKCVKSLLVLTYIEHLSKCSGNEVKAMVSRHDLIKGSSSSLLLSLLEEQAMYGYKIVKELEARSQGYFKFKEGTLYPALHRLEKAGLISGTWQMLPNGRQRRYYHITAKGQAKLAEEKTQWQDFLTAVKLILQPEPSSLLRG
jgi:PadR family transcriptional regulator PadR